MKAKYFFTPLILVTLLVALWGTLHQTASRAAPSDLPVFPGAEGFGTTTPAGSGRHLSPAYTRVYKVTNLDARGSGTLRECVEASVPRVCVFEVSGTIEINDRLNIDSPYITIAGQTAPSPGITLKGATLVVRTHDVLVQHLRVRVGDRGGVYPDDRDGIGLTGSGDRDVYNAVIDHCSVSWAIDGNVDFWGDNVNDVTVSNSIISEALHYSLHSEVRHSTGMLIGRHANRVAVHHSLFAHNNHRNPVVQPDTETELVNNLFYNWGPWGHTVFSDGDGSEPLFSNVIGNYYKPGNNTQDYKPIEISDGLDSSSEIYVKGNVGPWRPTDSGDEWIIVSGDEDLYRSLTPAVERSVLTVHPTEEAFEYVLSHAGARPTDRDEVDMRIVDDVRNETGWIIDSQDDVDGWPDLDENYRALILPANPNGDDDGDGYTNLEEWLHAFAHGIEGSGFTLHAYPSAQAVDPGGVAQYNIEVQPFGDFTGVVILSVTNPSSRLEVSLTSTIVAPSEQVTLTVVDEPDGSTQLLPGLMYSIPILGSSGNISGTLDVNPITSTLDVNLLVGGSRFYLPRVMIENP